MNDKIKSFMEYVSSNEELMAELKSVTEGKSKEEQVSNILAFAKKHGQEFTEEDFASDMKNFSEDELGTVTGGAGCGCAIFGLGDKDGLFCGCGIPGFGGVDGRGIPSSQGGCVCAMVGAGTTRRH